MRRKEMTAELTLLNEPEYYLQKQKPIRHSAVSKYRGVLQTFQKYSLAHSKLLCKRIFCLQGFRLEMMKTVTECTLITSTVFKT